MSKLHGATLNSSCQGWYPDKPDNLKGTIEGFLNKITTSDSGQPVALIVPHAGLAWSGQTAAYGYKELLSREIEYVFILGPAHRFHTDKLILPSSSHFKTPLGSLEIDADIKKSLLKEDIFQDTDEAFYGENSIELQIVLLQRVLPDCKIIPIVVGQLDLEKIAKAAEIFKKYSSKNSIFIISSDISRISL